MLFAVGGLFATFFASSSIPYLTALQQRRPLLIALLVAGAWFIVGYVVLELAGPRGGGFGGAYAVRYTVLGATSFPDVLPQALTHPGAAAAALQFDGAKKILFLELVILATGAISVLGGLRYILPVAGYMTLAFLSNNAGLYIFGTQYAALILGFMFVAAIEGTVVILDFTHGLKSDQRRRDLAIRLVAEARDLTERLPASFRDHATLSRVGDRLARAQELLGLGKLGLAEGELEWVERALRVESRGRDRPPTSAVGAVGGPVATDRDRLIAPRRRTAFSLGRETALDVTVFATVVAIVLTTTALANPLVSGPLARGEAITYGLAGPNAHDQILQSVLQLVPPQAPVLASPHLFPELSSRHNAYVVVNGASLRGNENLSGDLNGWVNQSDFVAIDYRVDPTAAVFYRYWSNLSAFGLYAAEDGAYLYERGWPSASNPNFWAPWSSALAGGQLTANQGSATNQYANSSLGPALYHGASATSKNNSLIWSGPGMLYLPPGNYSVTFDLYLTAQDKGPQLKLQIRENPAWVNDSNLSLPGGERYHTVTIAPDRSATGILNQSTVAVPGTELRTLIQRYVTISFEWNSTGYVSFPGIELSQGLSVWLVSVQVLQQSSLE